MRKIVAGLMVFAQKLDPKGFEKNNIFTISGVWIWNSAQVYQ